MFLEANLFKQRQFLLENYHLLLMIPLKGINSMFCYYVCFCNTLINSIDLSLIIFSKLSMLGHVTLFSFQGKNILFDE